MNVLVTGITGSGGSYLADYILEHHKNVKISGLHRWHSAGVLRNIEHVKDKINILECDLLDLSSIIRALRISRPKKIFHLASFANVRKCFDTPLAVINNNIMGTANLLEAVRLTCPDTIILMCSTSEVYGIPKTTPISESHPLQPVNPYSVSKLSQEMLAYSYYKSWGLNVVITRAFTYLNPRRKDLFATSFVTQAIKVNKGVQDFLSYGNLESVRTLIDIRDMMEAYWVATEKCEFGKAYNIGGDITISVGGFLAMLCTYFGSFEVRQDKNLLRPVDITNQVPDTTLFKDTTGWKPRYSLKQSMEFLIEGCRKDVKNEL